MTQMEYKFIYFEMYLFQYYLWFLEINNFFPPLFLYLRFKFIPLSFVKKKKITVTHCLFILYGRVRSGGGTEKNVKNSNKNTFGTLNRARNI